MWALPQINSPSKYMTEVNQLISPVSKMLADRAASRQLNITVEMKTEGRIRSASKAQICKAS
jgi:hypothetical protein